LPGSGRVALDASASGAGGVGVAKVQYALTGGSLTKAVIATASLGLYGYLPFWNSTSVPSGTHALQSLATDTLGITAYSAGISMNDQQAFAESPSETKREPRTVSSAITTTVTPVTLRGRVGCRPV
jgi:hypothetical protein